MRVWTVQPISLYEKFKREKVLHADYSKSTEVFSSGIACECFDTAYKWMISQMKSRIGIKPELDNINLAPWWAWYKFDNKNRDSEDFKYYGIPGKEYAVIELDLPDNEVLLSDYDAWHGVLNKWYIDDSTNEEEYDKNHDWFNSLSAEEQDRVRTESWNKIFDITVIDNDWYRNGFYVQATFWELRLDNIKSVKTIVCENAVD